MSNADAILATGVGFEAIEQVLSAQGWQRVAVPGLSEPLVANEPELARFEKDGVALTYTFNPAVRLRLIAGPVPDGLDIFDQHAIREDLSDAVDDERRLRAILGCVAMGWTELEDDVARSVDRLDPDVVQYGISALEALRTIDSSLADERAAGAAEQPRGIDVPVGVRLELIRRASASGAEGPAVPIVDLIGESLIGSDAELAATACIAAARLKLTELAEAVSLSRPEAAARTRDDRRLFVAIRTLSVETLRGGRPGSGPPDRDLVWRCLLGEPVRDDDIDDRLLTLFSLAAPSPEPVMSPFDGFRVVEAVDHWLGHDARRGVPNPIRRWRPDTSFVAREQPLAAPVRRTQIDTVLADCGATIAREVRLISADEYEAALRGPNGNRRPWGLGERPRAEQWSPWGFELGPPGEGEWARGQTGEFVIVGSERTGVVAHRAQPDDETMAHVRPVLL